MAAKLQSRAKLLFRRLVTSVSQREANQRITEGTGGRQPPPPAASGKTKATSHRRIRRKRMIPHKGLAARVAQNTVTRLRELLAGGATLANAAQTLGLKPTFVHKLATRRRLPRRRRALPASTLRKVESHIEAAKLTLSEIAKRLRISKSTVCRQRQRILERQAGTTFNPRRVKRAIRCPNGHLTQFTPCVECAAAAGETQ